MAGKLRPSTPSAIHHNHSFCFFLSPSLMRTPRRANRKLHAPRRTTLLPPRYHAGNEVEAQLMKPSGLCNREHERSSHQRQFFERRWNRYGACVAFRTSLQRSGFVLKTLDGSIRAKEPTAHGHLRTDRQFRHYTLLP